MAALLCAFTDLPHNERLPCFSTTPSVQDQVPPIHQHCVVSGCLFAELTLPQGPLEQQPAAMDVVTRGTIRLTGFRIKAKGPSFAQCIGPLFHHADSLLQGDEADRARREGARRLLPAL